jgi:alpha-L-rhamnosidase
MRNTILLSSLILLCFESFGVVKPENLRCEYISNPLGIDSKKPRLSWTFRADELNYYQTAFEIIVGENEVDVKSGKGNVWTSGKTINKNSIQIEYDGAQLKSFTRYYWAVRTYDAADKVSEWSSVAWFETSMLQQNDWTAQWIGDGSKPFANDADAYKDDPMPLFRKEFTASKKISTARLYITGLGYYEAYLNGKKIGDHVLDPGWTTYRKQVQYSTYDVTAHVMSGNNGLGVILGNGWWNPLPFKFFGRWDLRDFQQTGRPCLKAELHLRYSDGTTEKIVTDESWKTTNGPIVRNNVYLGEHYDARLEIADWNLAKSKYMKWKNVSVVRGPDGMLTAQMQPPIRVTKVLKPVSITEWKPGIFIVDMGQNFAGVSQINVKGPAGTKITIRSGEGLFNDGSLNVMTTVATQIKKGGIKGGPGSPETAWQEDSYTLKGSGTETWSPRFTFHGFRYLEVTGWPGKPTIENFRGLRMNSDLPVTGSFTCSNENFDKLHEVIQWTFLSNVFSVQSDCPGREKMGYGADMVVSANAFIYNYDMSNFYTKAVNDFANEQRPQGGITEIAPFTGIDDRGYGDLSGPMGWQLGYTFLQKQLYDFYGDKRIIENQYPAVQTQIEFLKSQAKNNLFYWDISDHEALEPKPESFSASVFYYHHVLLAAEFAGLVGKKEDSVRYAKLHQQIKKRIVEIYYVPNTGRFDNATQAAQIFGLWYNLSPDKNGSLKLLDAELKRHDNHLTTGIFTTKMFFDVMREEDKSDEPYTVVNQKTYPGWLHMLEEGATTLWETWKFPETGPSRNHPMFGSVDEWFYRSILGINPLKAGFEKFMIKPQLSNELSFAKGSYESVRGKIVSDWKIVGDKFSLTVEVPGNTSAEVWIPAKQNSTVMDGERVISDFKYQNGYAVVNVRSGKYTFTSTR